MTDRRTVRGEWYTVTLHPETRLLKIVARRGKWYMFAPMVSACDSPGKRDTHRELSRLRLVRRGRTTVLTYTEKSDLWDRKLYTVEFRPRQIRYSYRVRGKGRVGRAHFLRSWFESARTVETELGVVPGYDTVFSPAVNFMGKVHHFAGDTAVISAGEDRTYWGAGLVSAPCCFGLNDRGDGAWVWAGLGARPGEWGFDTFTYNSNVTGRVFGAGGFDCDYAGKLRIDGEWRSPQLVLGLAGDPYDGLRDYVRMLARDFGLKRPARRRPPAWWREPIFCGWGEQMSLGYRDCGNFAGVDHGRYCTQANHDDWLGVLARHGIRPGQVIIDAGWQRAGSTGDMYVDEGRWPDLRGWIDARRADGVHVILWMCAWNRQGVGDRECITRDGKAVTVDPTNPRYERRLRAMIRRLLGAESGCYNADGLKIDGELGCPIGPGLKNRGGLWGHELQRHYLNIIRHEARKWKPDALVGTFTANPYLGDASDVVRTADLFSVKGSPADTMVHRAKVLSIGQPGCPIDTDHCYWYDLRDNWIDIMSAQLACGVPSVYHARHVWHNRPFAYPHTERMTDEHYAVIRRTFRQYRRRLRRSGRKRRSPRSSR